MVLHVSQQVQEGMLSELKKTLGDQDFKGKCNRVISQEAHPYSSKTPTKCCYSCEEDGHLSRNCPNKKLRFSTNVVEYQGKEYEDMMAKITSVEEKNQDNRDMSKVFCYCCRETGHFTDECPKKRKDLSRIQCYKCRNLGHYSSNCPERKKKKLNP